MHDRRKSLENDLPFELRPEDAVDDNEHELELQPPLLPLLAAAVVKRDDGANLEEEEEEETEG